MFASKNGSLHICVGYQKLNAATVRISYPLPRKDKCIESLGDAQVFSTLDAHSGYSNIEVHDKDRHKM